MHKKICIIYGRLTGTLFMFLDYFHLNSAVFSCLFVFHPLGGTTEPDACTWSIYWAKAFVWPENPAFRHCLFSHQTQHLSWASVLLATLRADRFLSAIFRKSSLSSSDCQSEAPDSTASMWLASPVAVTLFTAVVELEDSEEQHCISGLTA